MEDAVVIVGKCDVVGDFFDGGLCVCHGNAESCGLDHGDVVVAVSAADHLFGGQSDACEEFRKGVCLIDVLRHDFEEERVGAVDVEQSVKCGMSCFYTGDFIWFSCDEEFVVVCLDMFGKWFACGPGAR